MLGINTLHGLEGQEGEGWDSCLLHEVSEGAEGQGGDMDRAWRALLSPSAGGRQGTALPGKDAPSMHTYPLIISSAFLTSIS